MLMVLLCCRVNYPSKAAALDADYHQKLLMSFYVKSVASSESIKAHQVCASPSYCELMCMLYA